jgi:CheY-like chemotaxis protein
LKKDGTRATYLAARIAPDHPDILARMKAGEFSGAGRVRESPDSPPLTLPTIPRRMSRVRGPLPTAILNNTTTPIRWRGRFQDRAASGSSPVKRGIMIPYTPDCRTRSPVPAISDVAVLRVLIVEDQADGAESLAILLRLDGYDVEIARDGPIALEKAQAYRPDVVLLDLGLPRMSGYDVAKQMAARQPESKPFLIALTGYGRDEDRQRSADAGFDMHLVKPVDPEELHGILDRLQQTFGE